MPTYVVGDIQGCFDCLRRLLDSVHFDPDSDTLWCVGDLVNRGPQSLQTLEFLYRIRHAVVSVLGNHDLHLLAIASGHHLPKRKDTLNEVLDSPLRTDLVQWLRSLPLVHYQSDLNVLMVHAGIPPMWGLSEALAYAKEVEATIQGEQFNAFMAVMYGDQPARFDAELTGFDRIRVITNYFTRMRLIDADGNLELTQKGAPPVANQAKLKYRPWFDWPRKLDQNTQVVFGHWAALSGQVDQPAVHALDTGCVWGRSLTLLRVDDFKRFFHQCGG